MLPDYRTRYEAVKNRPVELVACPYFTTTLSARTEPQRIDLAATDSFVVVICMEGRGTVADDSGTALPLRQGETLLVPASAASLEFIPEQGMKFLTSRID